MQSDDTNWKYSIEDLDNINTTNQITIRYKTKISVVLIVTLIAVGIIFFAIQSAINGNFSYDIYYMSKF